MELKMQTSLFLILGAIVSMVGWMFIYPGNGDGSASAADNAAALMGDPGLAKVGMLLGFGGMGAMMMGFLNIARKMAAGTGLGSAFANVSGVFSLALIIVMTLLLGVEWAAVEASSAEMGTALMQISKASETTFVVSMGLVLLTLGIGIIVEKNYHVIIGGFAVIVGATFLISMVGGGAGILGFISWIGMLIVGIAIGVQTLRSQS